MPLYSCALRGKFLYGGSSRDDDSKRAIRRDDGLERRDNSDFVFCAVCCCILVASPPWLFSSCGGDLFDVEMIRFDDNNRGQHAGGEVVKGSAGGRESW